MRGKYIVILVLVALLVFTVYKMMEFESSMREERTVKLYIEDDSKPLITKYSDELLKNAAYNSDYYFTANGDYFNMLKMKYLLAEKQLYWENVFVKGVNLGVAVPGKFPAEFSLSFTDYLEWLEMIGEMNSNTVRTYTILPPEFYDALSYYNLRHNNKPIYLIQGVWAKIPEDDNYFNAAYVREFQKEIIDMIDVIHGKAVLGEHTGKASGTYATDVSKYVVAFLLGREWEPSAVFKTNQTNNTTHFNGDFISMNNGNAMEAWLAEMMDFSVLYETQTYKFQHPVSFVNWLPLDPMFHNTEIIENKKVREYDNDLESIDFRKFNATELFFPGLYAVYHVYPYYPDFIYLQDSYKNARNSDNINDPYFGYLEDLKKHTQGMPLVIAEYGLPSSRGSSHFSPQGFHQGGHSEADQARLSLILTEDIVNTGCAGAIYFSWIDEWFKHNWLVMDFEQPFEDRKLWHNMENPEQNFGIYAMESRTKTIDGKLDDWDLVAIEADEIELKADADPTYFYITATLPDFNFNTNNLYFAIDTYDEEKGDHKLPFSDNEFDVGFEFLLEFKTKDSALILVDEPYSVFSDIYNDHVPTYASVKNSNGKFIHQLMLTNRGRVGLLDDKSDSVVVDRSLLVFGNSSDPNYSNADWYYNDSENTIEIRLDWHLLNVSDPAKRYVLDDQPGTNEIEYSKTDAVNIQAFVTDKNNNLITQYPEEDTYSFIWDEWEMPEYKSRLKPIYYTLQEYFNGLNPGLKHNNILEVNEDEFDICDFFNNKSGAISLGFENGGFSQFHYALPVLSKYGMSASFAVLPGLMNDSPGFYNVDENIKVKRYGFIQAQEIAKNHDIAVQVIDDQFIDQGELITLEREMGTDIPVLYVDDFVANGFPKNTFVFVRNLSKNDTFENEFQDVNYTVSGSNISQKKLDSLIHAQHNNWTILTYHHFFSDQKEIPSKLSKEKQDELFISQADFEKQIRLLRNSNYWVSTESNVYQYVKERNESFIRFNRFQNMIFLKIVNNLDMDKFNHPLTLCYTTSAKTIRIKGSETDGTYTNRTGSIYLNVMPNKEIIIEIIE